MEGYGDGTAQEDWASHLPSFANKANRELDAYIKRVRQELEYTDVSLEDNEDRVKVMSEHLANVQAELKYTQSRFNAKANEIQTEDHLKQLSKRQGVSQALQHLRLNMHILMRYQTLHLLSCLHAAALQRDVAMNNVYYLDTVLSRAAWKRSLLPAEMCSFSWQTSWTSCIQTFTGERRRWTSSSWS